MASLPKEGPTISDWIISAEAGNLPALNTFAKSMASFSVKLPAISERPPAIAPVDTPGAEYTMLSKTIAIKNLSVNSRHRKQSTALKNRLGGTSG